MVLLVCTCVLMIQLKICISEITVQIYLRLCWLRPYLWPGEQLCETETRLVILSPLIPWTRHGTGCCLPIVVFLRKTDRNRLYFARSGTECCQVKQYNLLFTQPPSERLSQSGLPKGKRRHWSTAISCPGWLCNSFMRCWKTERSFIFPKSPPMWFCGKPMISQSWSTTLQIPQQPKLAAEHRYGLCCDIERNWKEANVMGQEEWIQERESAQYQWQTAETKMGIGDRQVPLGKWKKDEAKNVYFEGWWGPSGEVQIEVQIMSSAK